MARDAVMPVEGREKSVIEVSVAGVEAWTARATDMGHRHGFRVNVFDRAGPVATFRTKARTRRRDAAAAAKRVIRALRANELLEPVAYTIQLGLAFAWSPDRPSSQPSRAEPGRVPCTPPPRALAAETMYISSRMHASDRKPLPYRVLTNLFPNAQPYGD